MTQRAPSRRRSAGGTSSSQPIARHVLPDTNSPDKPKPAPSVGGSFPCVFPRGDTVGLELPQLGTHGALTHVTQQTMPVAEALNKSLCPGFLRRRFPPTRHRVVTAAIDRDLRIAGDKDVKELAMADSSVGKI